MEAFQALKRDSAAPAHPSSIGIMTLHSPVDLAAPGADLKKARDLRCSSHPDRYAKDERFESQSDCGPEQNQDHKRRLPSL